MSICVSCNQDFMGFGERGICGKCKRKLPGFIPQERLSRDSETPGYVFRAAGAIRYDLSDTAKLKGDAPRHVYRRPMDEVFPHSPLPKRTPQERLDSLTKRIAATINTLGDIPDSLLKEVRAEQIAQGKKALSVEQLRQLAGFYLHKAERDSVLADQHRITRTWSG